jgi:Rieske Fe-S protein
MERRNLLRGAAGAAAVGMTAPLLTACGGESEPTGSDSDTSLAPTSGDAVQVDISGLGDGSFVVTESVVVIKDGDDVVAYSAICPHQSCPVDKVEDGVISCPCHGSRFSVEDGSVISGPAQRGLTPATVTVEGTTATVTLA